MSVHTNATHQEAVRLYKIKDAAVLMAVSIPTAYREIKAGRLGPLVKVGARGSALPSTAVNQWIADRIAESEAA